MPALSRHKAWRTCTTSASTKQTELNHWTLFRSVPSVKCTAPSPIRTHHMPSHGLAACLDLFSSVLYSAVYRPTYQVMDLQRVAVDKAPNRYGEALRLVVEVDNLNLLLIHPIRVNGCACHANRHVRRLTGLCGVTIVAGSLAHSLSPACSSQCPSIRAYQYYDERLRKSDIQSSLLT